jgi:hypothetical protein
LNIDQIVILKAISFLEGHRKDTKVTSIITRSENTIPELLGLFSLTRALKAPQIFISKGENEIV